MPRFRYLPYHLAILAALAIASVGSPATAQPGAPPTPPTLKLAEPSASRVYQRETNGLAEIPVVLEGAKDGQKLMDVTISGGNAPLSTVRFVDGKIVGVPTGGPYTISAQVQTQGRGIENLNVNDVYVGDLWVLSGQSNMEGVGNLIDVAPPHPRVMMLGMDGRWKPAEEPLHWLLDSPDPVHSGDPKTREARAERAHKTRRRGAGLGLPFASALTDATGVPIGLVICAHGGTSMDQWDPSKKDQGGQSLYGSMLRQFKLAGGKVRGLLWYQGESDAHPGAAEQYGHKFAHFIEAVRSDFGQPELPFYFVQIGRFVHGGDPKSWNTVQEAQRRLPERVPNTAVVSVIDLELDDPIHVGTQGHKRAGLRLARIAERELFGQVGATTPTLDSVAKGPNNTLVVRFKGVNRNITSTNGQAMMRRIDQMMINGSSNVPQAGSPAMMGMMGGTPSASSESESPKYGLRPDRHIAGFSIRKADGTELPILFEAAVGGARDTVVLKLAGKVPAGAMLWYGYGYDPYCNLVDSMDMAVPTFGPVALDEVLGTEPTTAAARPQSSHPIRALVITGDNVSAHKWRETSAELKKILEKGGKIHVDISETPSKDLTDENLAKYDVLILNYRETPKAPSDTVWSEANKEAFLKAVRGGKGVVGYHYGSAAFARPNWVEFEKAVAGGWRSQGFHGPAHAFTVKKTDVKHPISEGLPAKFDHEVDELYQNSMLTPGSVVLATAYSDPSKPKGTGKDEPVIWVNHYGMGRVFEDVLGHDVKAMSDPEYQKWLVRGVTWAATGKTE